MKNEWIIQLCKQNYVFRSAASLAAAAEQAAAQGLDVIACPRPLDPGRLEAVLLPELSLALLAPPPAESAASVRALERAVEKLREAKSLHDELEAVIRPFMDFTALDAYAERCLGGIFASS